MASPRFKKTSWTIATLATWAALAGAAFGLVHDLKNELNYWLVVGIAPSVALLCGLWSVRLSSAAGKVARVIFWIPTILGAFAVAVLFQGQCELLLQKPGNVALKTALLSGQARSLLLCAALIPLLLALGLIYRAWRNRHSPSDQGAPNHRWLWDLATALPICAAIFGSGLLWLNDYAVRFQNKGLDRWKEIGRPMPEFAKNQKPIEENASLNGLLKDFQPYGMRSLYKVGTSKYNRGPANDPDHAAKPEFGSREAIELISTELPPGDKVDAPAEKAPHLAAQADELSALYRSILSRPAPVWECHLADGFDVSVPNFLFLRKLAQTMRADAALKLARGDREGAAMAVAAGLRATDSLTKSPILVSFMIRTAIEALFAPVSAHLPAEPDGWERLARDADAKRAALKNAIQSESLTVNNLAENASLKDFSFVYDTILFSLAKVPWFKPAFPRWFQPCLCRSTLRLESGRNSMVLASVIDFWNHEDLLASSDFGDREECEISEHYPSFTAPSVYRAWGRLNLCLLLQEQAEMIRFARAQMATGSAGNRIEHPSVVVPGARWEGTLDANTYSVALKLTPTPAWAINSPLAGEGFFLLPLDGSKSWTFARP